MAVGCYEKKTVEFGVTLQPNLALYRYDNRNENTEKCFQAATAIDPRFTLILFDKEVCKRVRQTLLKLDHKVEGCLQSENDVEVQGVEPEVTAATWPR